MRWQWVPGEGQRLLAMTLSAQSNLSSKLCSNAGLQRHEGASPASMCPPRGGKSR